MTRCRFVRHSILVSFILLIGLALVKQHAEAAEPTSRSLRMGFTRFVYETTPEAVAASRKFPDPLVMTDGRRITTPAQWFEERRPELMVLFQEVHVWLPASGSRQDHRQTRAGEPRRVRREGHAQRSHGQIWPATTPTNPPDVGHSQQSARPGAGYSGLCGYPPRQTWQALAGIPSDWASAKRHRRVKGKCCGGNPSLGAS